MQRTHGKEHWTQHVPTVDLVSNPTSFRPHIPEHRTLCLNRPPMSNTLCNRQARTMQSGKAQVPTSELIPAAGNNIVQLRIFCFEVLPARLTKLGARNYAVLPAYHNPLQPGRQTASRIFTPVRPLGTSSVASRLCRSFRGQRMGADLAAAANVEVKMLRGSNVVSVLLRHP